jgi:hypothetical protein
VPIERAVGGMKPTAQMTGSERDALRLAIDRERRRHLATLYALLYNASRKASR